VDRYRDIPEARVRELVAEAEAGRFPQANLARLL
jgi:hypothetical protein